MSYFEHHLPEKAPAYVHEDNRPALQSVLDRVRRRMERLEEALLISGLDGETFAEYVKPLFDNHPKRFEEMTTDYLAQYALTVHDGQYKAPGRMVWPNAETLVDTAFLATEEWEAIRHLGIGGSDASAVLGKSAYTSPNELYQDKCWTPKVYDRDGTSKQVIFDRGHFMESKVIDAFCTMYQAEVIPETRMFRSKKFPMCLADVDAFLRLPSGDIYVFESKTTIAENATAWADRKIPQTYIPQIQHYPAVMDDDRIKGVYIGCLFTYDYTIHGLYVGSGTDVGRFVSRLMRRDKRAEAKLLKKEQEFMEKHVLAQREPPYVGPYKEDMRNLDQYVGGADTSVKPVNLDESFLPLIQDWLALKAKKRTFKEQQDAVQELMDATAFPIAEALGQATKGIIKAPDGLGDFYEVSYGSAMQTNVDKVLLEGKYPDAFDECVSVAPKARSFSIKVKAAKQ